MYRGEEDRELVYSERVLSTGIGEVNLSNVEGDVRSRENRTKNKRPL